MFWPLRHRSNDLANRGTRIRCHRSAQRAGLVLAALFVALATACSSANDDDGSPRLDSQSTVDGRSSAVDGRSSAVDGRSSAVHGEPGESVDSTAPAIATITPSATFQRLPGSLFGNVSQELIIEDAVPIDSGRWLFAGGLEDGTQRILRATVSVVSVDDPEAGRRIPLPDDGADRSTANAIIRGDDGVVVGGSTETGERTSAVLWSANRALDRWQLLKLPTDPSDGHTEVLHLAQRNGDRYALGQTGAEELGRPLVWRETEGAWQQLAVTGVAESGGAESDASGLTELEVQVFGAAVGPDGLVMVGRSSASLGDPEPRFWRERDGRLLLGAGQGLPSGGSLYDVVVADDGAIVAVGASTEGGVSTPILARSFDGGETWTTNSAMPDLAGWVSFDGVEFARLLLDGDEIYTVLTNPVVQQLLRSSDAGRSWQRVGNLSLEGDNFVPAHALARADDGTILVTGADVAMTWSGEAWSAITDDALPRQLGALQALDVVAIESGFLIGGGRTARVGGQLGFEAGLWQSADGSQWGRPPVDQPSGYLINDVFEASDGRAAAFKAGGSYFRPVHLLRPDDSGRWQSTLLPVGEAFLDHALGGAAASVVAAGTRPRQDLSQTEPLFVVIEVDGELREVPLTNSPVGTEANGSVNCLAGELGAMLAVLESGDGEIGIAVSSNGERWQGLEIGDELDDLSLPACHGDGEQFVLAGRDAAGRAVVVRSPDGESWTVEVLSENASILGVDEVAGQLFLSGWRTSANQLGRDATIWRPSGASWEALPNNGLQSDSFSRQTEVTGIAVNDGVVVAVGTDRGRAGAWVATAEAIGL